MLQVMTDAIFFCICSSLKTIIVYLDFFFLEIEETIDCFLSYVLTSSILGQNLINC